MDEARMKEEADALIAKLMDEENHKQEVTDRPPVIAKQVPLVPNPSLEKWYYRDPQGDCQGPFTANEMTDWYKAGYFTAGLLVRRQYDERYITLGDLTKLCGRIPFVAGPPIPPLKVRH